MTVTHRETSQEQGYGFRSQSQIGWRVQRLEATHATCQWKVSLRVCLGGYVVSVGPGDPGQRRAGVDDAWRVDRFKRHQPADQPVAEVAR